MPSIFKLFIEPHILPHNLEKKKQYGKISLFDWNNDLSQQWYVYYTFRNPDTKKLTRQNNIYGNINTFETIRERNKAAKIIMEALKTMLENGFNPYEDTAKSNTKKTISDIKTVQDAVKFALNHAKITYAEASYPDFKSRIKQFEKYLIDNQLGERPIKDIGIITVLDFLNAVLERSSARNRNNTRTSLSSFYKILKDNFIVDTNFIDGISVLTSKPTKNKTFTTTQEEKIVDRMEKNDPLMGLFIKFVSINLLRPIEICRLKVEDISIQDRVLRVKAKNQPTKTKIIPSLLFNQLPELHRYDRSDLLFTPNGPGKWDATEVSRRNWFTDRFKQVKEYLNLGEEYGIYSFRHTYIIKIYRELRIEYAPFEAKTRLMHITGHSSMKALDSYLREIDAELPDDYSHLLRTKPKSE